MPIFYNMIQPGEHDPIRADVKGESAPKVEVTIVVASDVANTLVGAGGAIGEDEGSHCAIRNPSVCQHGSGAKRHTRVWKSGSQK